MPRTARLQRREQFSDALAAGQKQTRRHFTLYALRNGQPGARVGIIVSKRVARRAVDRNRVKRLVREVFRSMRFRLQGYDLVVQMRRCPPPGAAAAARAEVAKLLEEFAVSAGS